VVWLVSWRVRFRGQVKGVIAVDTTGEHVYLHANVGSPLDTHVCRVRIAGPAAGVAPPAPGYLPAVTAVGDVAAVRRAPPPLSPSLHPHPRIHTRTALHTRACGSAAYSCVFSRAGAYG
jgi:hypothetical protein